MNHYISYLLLLTLLAIRSQATDLDSSLLGTWDIVGVNKELTITPNILINNGDTLTYNVINCSSIKLNETEVQITFEIDDHLLIATITKDTISSNSEKAIMVKNGYEFQDTPQTKKRKKTLLGLWSVHDSLNLPSEINPLSFSYMQFCDNDTLVLIESFQQPSTCTFQIKDKYLLIEQNHWGPQMLHMQIIDPMTIELQSLSDSKTFYLHKETESTVILKDNHINGTIVPSTELSQSKKKSSIHNEKLTPKQKGFLGTWILDPALPQESRTHKSLQFTPDYVIYIRDNYIDTCDYLFSDSNQITLSTDIELTFSYTLSPTSLTLVNDLQVIPFVKKGKKHRASKLTRTNKKRLKGKWVVTRVREGKTSFIAPLDDGDTVTYLFNSSDTLDYFHNGESKGRKPYYLRDNYFCFDPMYSQKFEFVRRDSLIIKQLSEDLILYLSKEQ